MKCLLIATWLILLALCHSSATDLNNGYQEVLESGIENDIIGMMECDDHNSFFIELKKAVSVATSCTLSYKLNEKNKTLSHQSTCSEKKIRFPASLTEFIPHENVNLIFKATDSYGITLSMANTNITSFPKFSGELYISQVYDPLGNGNTFVRIDGEMNDMTEINELPNVTPVGENSVKYYLDIPSADELFETVTLCCTTTDEVQICDKPYKVNSGGSSNPGVTSAILSYVDMDQTKSGKVIVTATASIQPVNDESTSYDIIVTSENTGQQVLCANKMFTPGESSVCGISWDAGNDTAEIKVVGIINHSINGITSNPIQDRMLKSVQIGSTVIEGSWNMLSEDNHIYRLRKTTINDQLDAEDVAVDCTSERSDYCFGYFTDAVLNDNYTLTIAAKSSDSVYAENTQVESDILNIESYLDLQVEAIRTDWDENLIDVNTTICFSHKTPNEERRFSHYEMLLINTKGQWMKHTAMEFTPEDNLCFTPFTLNTKNFNITQGAKVIVSQRATDGITVLASGEIQMFD